MNITVFSAIYPAPSHLGIPNDTKVVHYYAKRWQMEGHRVQVVLLHLIPVKKWIKNLVSGKKLCYETDYEWEGIPVHLLEYQLFVPHANFLLGLQAKDADRRLRAFLKESVTPDRVFVHFPCSFMGMSAVSDFSCPTMAVLHNVDVKIWDTHPQLDAELNRYGNLGGRNERICSVISKRLHRSAVPVLSGIDEGLIPSASWIEEKVKRQGKRLEIVYAGNLTKPKKVDTIIAALKKVKFDFRFRILGSGVEEACLKKMAADDERILFCGRMSREDTVAVMREADVFCMVSTPETLGLVYLEAMAQGCVTIGSRGEGIDGILLHKENGFLVPPENADALAECLQEVAALSPEKKEALVLSAYKTASSMTDGRMAELYFHCNEKK